MRCFTVSMSPPRAGSETLFSEASGSPKPALVKHDGHDCCVHDCRSVIGVNEDAGWRVSAAVAAAIHHSQDKSPLISHCTATRQSMATRWPGKPTVARLPLSKWPLVTMDWAKLDKRPLVTKH